MAISTKTYQAVQLNSETGDYETVTKTADPKAESLAVRTMRVGGNSVIINVDYVVQRTGRNAYKVSERVSLDDFHKVLGVYSTPLEVIKAAYGLSW